MVNLLDAISGVTYPEKSILIPTDFKTLQRIGELELEIAALRNGEDSTKLVKEQAGLITQVRDTSWTFTLRGLPNSLVDVILKAKRAKIKDQVAQTKEFVRELIVTSIVKIVNSADEEAEFDKDSIGKFLDAVPEDVYRKFSETTDQLSGDSLRYEYTVTDPNFS